MFHPNEINVDIDRDRIRSILSEAYDSMGVMLDISFTISKEEFLSQIEPYLGSHRVTIPVSISLPSQSFPTMRIDVNLRNGKLFARFSHRKKQAYLNHYLKAL